MTQYKQLKPIRLEQICKDVEEMQCEDAETEFNKFLIEMLSATYGRFFQDQPFKYITLLLNQNHEWRDFAVKHGYVEIVKEEPTYYKGQLFERRNQLAKGRKYRLCIVDRSRMTLVDIASGSSWHYPPQSVKDPLCITAKEFADITDNKSKDFIAIDERGGKENSEPERR